MNHSLKLCVLLLTFVSLVSAEDDNRPKPIPQTRPEMKAALERLKTRLPRLPLPPVTEAEQAAASSGSLGIVNNGRMRNLYLPEELRGSGFSRQRDPQMTLDQTLSVELFWIASRVNNCHYCLGHQEVKLRSAGVTEETLAALDCDWKRFTPRERAAFTLAQRLTESPHALREQDFEEASKYFTPTEVLEIVFYVARYNSTNRWTDSLGIPQEDHRELNTDTTPEFAQQKSVVALTEVSTRGPLPSREAALQAMRDATEREPRVELVSAVDADKLIGELNLGRPTPNWVRLLARFPVAGLAAVNTYQKAQTAGLLSPKLKAQVAWIAARHDRAPYALRHAAIRLEQLGYQTDQMFQLENAEQLPNNERAALALTAKLTATPQAITDADIAQVREYYSEKETAELVYLITQAAFFDRITEGMRIPLE